MPLSPSETAKLLVHQSFPPPAASSFISLRVGDSAYIWYDFRITRSKTLFRLDRGDFDQLEGYWIFRPDVRACWQAVNGFGPLDWWNRDGKATGNPRPCELFQFVALDLEKGRVKIMNVCGAYVNLVDFTLHCSGDAAGAAVFVVANE